MDENMILSLFAPPKLDGIRRLLCIQPHSDDNEIGMGGIIASLVEKGVQVDYLTVTDGALGDNGIPYGEESLSLVRKREAEEAGRYLGAENFFFLSHGDGTLSSVPEIAREIAQIIRRGRYDAVAAPDPWNRYEAHFDHVVTGRAAAQAAISVSLRKYPENTETDPVELKAVLFYFTSRPNTFVDISPYFQKKMEAIALHRSQITGEMLELYGGYFMWRGMKMSGDGRIMEGVKALLPLHLHCIGEAEDI